MNEDKISAMRWIYISPHFDDAVLSCGGLISDQTRRGTPVEIWTVCAGLPPQDKPLSPLAKRIHKDWKTNTGRGTVILRRKEDRAAAAAVGATVRHLSIPDCIYRWSAEGAPLYPIDVFDPPRLEDKDLPAAIAAMLKRGLRKSDVVIAPLSVGHHVDHVLTRMGAEETGSSLVYYVDTPYILNSPRELKPASKGMASELYKVTRSGLKAWQSGILAYRSQIESLFGTNENMKEVIQSYWVREYGIRLWSRD